MISKGWTYDEQAFYTGMGEGNLCTSFLGSYTTKITITHLSGNSYQLDFHISNMSGWESATRLRIDNDGIGGHDGIFPNKPRGIGLHLGGDFDQDWYWEETVIID